MQLLMLGTGPFAVPTFQALVESRHRVCGLATAAPSVHRGKVVAPVSSIRDIALGHGIPVFDPEDINAPDARARLAALGADLMVVCDYGQILSPETLAVARLGAINLHASLLPKYRGAAPIPWAIYHGETETGLTVFQITPRLDAGPCIVQVRVPIGPEETAGALETRLSRQGSAMVLDAIDLLEQGRAAALPQDAALASRAPKLKKIDGLIDWSRPAEAIKNHVRAMEPWPRTFTYWHRPAGAPLRLILGPLAVVEKPLAADAIAGTSAKAEPGVVLEAAEDRLIVAAGSGAVSIAALQPAGKRMMSAADFLRGHPVRPGDRFGPSCPGRTAADSD